MLGLSLSECGRGLRSVNHNTRSGRTSRRSTIGILHQATDYSCQALESRTLLCGLHDGVLLPAPEFDWSLEHHDEASLTSGPGVDTTTIVWSNRGLASDNF